jgi:transposase
MEYCGDHDEGTSSMATSPTLSLRALTPEEHATLERLGRATSERVDHVRRAQAILAVAHGASFAAAARQVGLRSRTTVADLVRRFNQHGLAALRIGTGRGRKPTYDRVARAAIVAAAQRTPDRRADGTATWSLKTLQRTLRTETYPRLGATTIRRVLEQAGSSYQRTRSWCPTGTAQRVRKAGLVTVVDPQTEEKRGASSKRIVERKQPASPCGVKMRPVRIRRCLIRVQVGNRKVSPRAKPTSMSATAPPSCSRCFALPPARSGPRG